MKLSIRLVLLKVSLLIFLFLYFFNSSYAAGIIQLSLDGNPLSSASVTDRNTGRSFTTDINGKFDFSNNCGKFTYQKDANTKFGMISFCGINDTQKLYKFDLTEMVTVSGIINVNETCNCILRFRNLENYLEFTDSSGLRSNLSHNFSQEVPAGRYRISVFSESSPEPENEFYIASVGVDARNGSVSNIELSASDESITYRFPKTPPRADLISVIPTDDSRFSLVTGAPGAAEPLVPLSLVNLQTGQVLTGASETDGSFSISFFAPPGASIQITQDHHAEEWSTYTSKAAGTVIKAPLENPGISIATGQRLIRGFVNDFKDLKVTGGRDPGVIWLTGDVDTNIWEPGRTGTLNGSAAIYSRSIGEGAIPVFEQDGEAYLELLFDKDGKQKSAGPENSSSDMTITGLPIDRSEAFWAEGIYIGKIKLKDYVKTNDSSGEAKWSLEYKVPNDLPDGIYQLVLTGSNAFDHLATGLESEQLYYEDVYGTPSSHLSTTEGTVQIKVGSPDAPRLYASILLNTFSNGSRGVVAEEDAALNFGLSNRLVTNPDKFIIPPSIRPDGSVHQYNIEPFIPLTAYSNKEWLSTPKVGFKFPSGKLSAKVTYPDGSTKVIGPFPIRGSYVQHATTDAGEDPTFNSNEPDMHYALTTYQDDFNLVLNQYGEHIIDLSGSVEDDEGNKYLIDGTYPVYVAELLDIETGVFPGTPFEVGDTYASSLIIQPGVSANVDITINHYPNSSAENKETIIFSGKANRFGYYSSNDATYQFQEPGEYVVDYEITYKDTGGKLWMASRKWASIVETPESNIIARGARGSEGNEEDKQWYLFEDSGTQNTHFFTPFQTGDVMWTENFTEWNAAMTPIVTLEDSGTLDDLSLMGYRLWDINGSKRLVSTVDAKSKSEIPPFVDPDQPNIHWGYYYTGIGRPGVAVREFVGTATSANAYWRFDTPYAYQLGSGYGGDRPNDFKFIFGGAVYKVPDSDFYYYGAYGSLWTMLPESDQVGGRVMPPFQGAAGGPSGGPLFTLLNEEIDIFAHPLGIRPGSILDVGDVASFSFQIAPTLPSKIEVSIESPSGSVRNFKGIANKIGYFYDPNEDYIISEPGVHKVRVHVVHDGMTSAGKVEPPYPEGSVLGATDGEYEFYVASANSRPAKIKSDLPDKLGNDARLSMELSSAKDQTVTKMHHTAVIPGFILSQDSSTSPNYIYDAYDLSNSFPNLDLPGGSYKNRNGADTITLSFLLEERDAYGNTWYEGRQALIQGEDILAPDQVKEVSIEEVVNKISSNSILKNIRTSDGTKTTAKFSAGATDDYGETISSDFKGGSSITIAGSVSPQEEDIGKSAEIYVVLLSGNSLTTLNVDGNYQNWKGSLKNIQPAYEINSLKSQNNIQIFSGNIQKGLYKIFIGYRLNSGGPIHFNSSALRITVI